MLSDSTDNGIGSSSSIIVTTPIEPLLPPAFLIFETLTEIDSLGSSISS